MGEACCACGCGRRGAAADQLWTSSELQPPELAACGARVKMVFTVEGHEVLDSKEWRARSLLAAAVAAAGGAGCALRSILNVDMALYDT